MARGVVGSIALKALPDTTEFGLKLQKYAQKVEQRYRSKPIQIAVEPKLDQKKVNEIRRRLEESFVGLDADVRANLNKASVKKAEAELRELADAIKAEVKPVLDKAKMTAVSAAIAKVFRRVDSTVFVGLDPASLAASKLGLVNLTRGPYEATVIPKMKSLAPVKKELSGKPWYVQVQGAFKPGSLDGLKGAFYNKFPTLKPWVWPQIDWTQLKKSGTNAVSKLQNMWNSSKMLSMRTTVRTVLDKASKGRVESALKKLGNSRIAVTAKAAWSKIAESKMLAQVKKAASKANAIWKASGIGGFIRWHVQLKTEGAIKGVKKLGNIIKKTLTGSAITSGINMIVAPLLAGIGNIAGAIKQMGPALGAAAGVMGAFAVGAGIAAVALKDAKNQLADLTGPLKGVQQGIIDAFWGVAKAPILENSKKLIDELGPSINKVATSMGGVFAKLADGVGNSSSQMKTVLDNTASGFDNMAPGIQRFVEGFMRLFEAGSSFFPQFGTWIDELSQKFTAWLDGIDASSGLVSWMQGGVDAAKAFVSILGSLGGIIGSVFGAASSGGGGLQVFADELDRIEGVIKSPAVQNGLVALFEGGKKGASEITGAISDVLSHMDQLGPSIGAVTETMGKTVGTLISTVGDALASGPAQSAISSLTTGFNALVEAVAPLITQLFDGFAPILEQIGNLFTDLAPQVGDIASHFGELAVVTFENVGNLVQDLLPPFLDIVDKILPVITDLAEAVLPTLVDAAKDIMDALGPVVDELMPVFKNVVDELVPPLMDLISTVVPPVVDAIAEIAEKAIGLVDDVLPVLEGLIGWVSDNANWLLPLVGGVAGAAGGLSKLGGAVKAFQKLNMGKSVSSITKSLGSMIGKTNLAKGAQVAWSGVTKVATGVQKLFNLAMNASPLTKIITLITLVVGALVAFFTKTEIGKQIWEKFTNFLSGVWEGIKAVWDAVWGAISDALSAIWDGITSVGTAVFDGIISFFTGLWDIVTTVWETVWDTISGVLSAVWDTISSVATTVWEGVTSFFSTLWDTISEVWGVVWDTLSTVLSAVWDGIKLAGETVWNGIVTFLTDLWNGIQIIWDTVWNTISTVAETIWTTIQTVATTIWDAISTAISTVIYTIQTVISTVLDTISTVWDTVWNTISNVATTIWDGIKSVVSGAINGVKDTISSVVNGIKNTWETVWDGIKNTVDTIWGGIKSEFDTSVSTIKNVFSKIGDAIKSPLETAFNAVKSLWNSTIGKLSFKVPDWVPGIGGKGFEMPKLAEGGIITRPTVALVGEVPGVSEAVIPLPKLQPMIDAAVSAAIEEGGSAAGGGDTYNVTVNVKPEDLRDFQSLIKFIDRLGYKVRAGSVSAPA